ncbi:MAG: transposase [Bacteroidia bacterium]|nr:transposase [Bacteroidia bacterium]
MKKDWSDKEKLDIIAETRRRGIIITCRKYKISVSTLLEWEKSFKKKNEIPVKTEVQKVESPIIQRKKKLISKIKHQRRTKPHVKLKQAIEKSGIAGIAENTQMSILEYFFIRNGCIREPPDLKAMKKRKSLYKKGYEVRFTAFNCNELDIIRKAIESLGYNLRKPFVKVNRYIQPVYGIDLAFRLWKFKQSKKNRNK